MRFEGNPEVLRNLIRRQRLMAEGNVSQYEIKPAIFASTGVRRGVFGGGKGRALERRKLNHVVTHVVGSSTGAAGGQFFLAGQIHETIDLHWVEGGSEDFISFKRFWRGGRPVQDTAFLCEAFRRRLDLDAFNACSAEFWVGVTCALTGEGRFLNAKRPDMHPVDIIRASISIPGFCGGPVVIDGNPYYDGAGAMGMPTREIIEQFSPTDLLIFPNCPTEEKGSRWEKMEKIFTGSLLSFKKESLGLKKAFLSRHTRFAEGVKYLRDQKECRWAIVWSDDSIGQFERDPLKLEDAANRADKFMSDLLDQAEADVEREQTQPLAAE